MNDGSINSNVDYTGTLAVNDGSINSNVDYTGTLAVNDGSIKELSTVAAGINVEEAELSVDQAVLDDHESVDDQEEGAVHSVVVEVVEVTGIFSMTLGSI